MTDQPQETGKAPVPGAAPAPVPARQQPAAAEPAPESRIAELEAELAKLRADAIAGAKTVLRVLKPHVSFTHAGITVSADPTPVPQRAVADLLDAAAEAGVNIKEV